jgi:signal transduction histidine kinase
MAPLAMQDKVVGILLFEAMQPAELQSRSDYAIACRIAAFAMIMAKSVEKHEHLSEQFVHTLGTLRRTRTELAKTHSMQGLAEMAAGAAHELNNPLAVISGRAQLLRRPSRMIQKSRCSARFSSAPRKFPKLLPI